MFDIFDKGCYDDFVNIVVLKHALKDISSLDARVKERVKSGIAALPAGDIKSLSGYDGLYRLRIGGYRVIFAMNDDTIVVRAVLPRGQAYKNL